MDLFTKAEVAEYLNQTLTTEQENLLDNQIIPAISQYARNFCNRDWDDAAQQTETFDAEGDRIFFVKLPPINSVVKVTVNDDELDSDDYFKYPTYIEINFTPTKGNQNVEVIYTSSATLPDDLKFSLVKWGSLILGKSGASSGVTEDELKRFTAGSVTVEFKDQDTDSTFAQGIYIPTFVYDALIRYRLEPK